MLLPWVKRFNKLQNSFVLKNVYALPGLSSSGYDAAHTQNKPPIGVMIDECFNPDDEWDTLFVIPPIMFKTKLIA